VAAWASAGKCDEGQGQKRNARNFCTCLDMSGWLGIPSALCGRVRGEPKCLMFWLPKN